MQQRWLAFASGVVLLTAALGVGEVGAEEVVGGELSRLEALIEGDGHRAKRLAAAHRIADLGRYFSPAEYSQRLRDLADRQKDPLAGFLLRRQARLADLERGDRGVSGDDPRFAAEQGCLVDWSLVGPFENSSMQGYFERFGPELGEPGPYTGRLSEVGWRDLNSGHRLCVYNLGSRVHPSTSAAVYLSTNITSEAGGPAQLLVGSHSAYRLWVNGEPVGEREDEFGLGIDAEGWPVDLRDGDNEVLLKLASTGQGGLSFVVRLVDEQETPLAGWTASPHSGPDEAVGEFEEEFVVQGGVKTIIEESAAGDQDQAARLGAALLWQQLYRRDASTPWRDVAEELAGEVEALSARQILWLVELFEEHWRRQAVLDEALEHRDDLLLRWRRAVERGRTMSHMQWEVQRAELAQIIDEAPAFFMAVESLAHWYQDHEGSERALRLVEGWDDPGREEMPAWLRLAADLNEQAGDRRRAAELREKAAATQQMSAAFGWQLVRQAMAEGDRDRALQMVEDYRRSAPWSHNWGLQQARIWRAAGDDARALEIVDELIEEAPGNAYLHMQRGEILVAIGDVDEAMASVQQAIALRPQARQYQEYLEHLQPESSRFYEPWIITGLREMADEVEVGSQTYDVLVDQRIHQVSSNGLARRFEQRANRVLRDEGVGSARQMRVSFQPGDERVEVLGVRVYKADGSISEDYDDWQTGRTRQSARMYNDRAYLNLRANNVDVGDVVEFRYVVHQVANENFRGDYFGAVRYIQQTRPVALSRYAVHYPKGWELHFRHPSLDYKRWDDALPDDTPADGERIAAFELRDVPRVHTESDQPGHTEVYDYILVSNKATYEEIGQWWWDLIEEQLVVDDRIRQAVAEVTEGRTSPEEKVEAIYEYVVRNTRYLHLGLGIHGWKPYRTSTVMRNRYGDCKDKAALLKVMIEEAGLDAEMVLVRTRRLGRVDDSPASMHVFNHAVTYVPELDLFLDATARFNGPYELTQMDQGAQALIVRDGGSVEWVTMPIDEPDDNLLRQELDIDLRGEVAVISGRVEAHGTSAVNYRRRFEDPERRDELFEAQLGRTFPGAVLLEAEYENLDALTRPTMIRFRAEVPGVLRGSPGAQSVYPVAAPRDLLGAHARQPTRHQDLMFRVPFANEAQVRFTLPDDLAVERIPDDQRVESEFGEMQMSYLSADDGSIVVEVRYAIGVQRVPVAQYEEFRQFVAEMDSAINETIRLIEEGGRR